MQAELSYTGQSDKRSAVKDALDMCEQLASCHDVSLNFRSGILMKSLVDIPPSVLPEDSVSPRQRYIEILTQIMLPSSSKWEEFYPLIEYANKRLTICNSTNNYSTKVDQLISVVEDPQRLNDYAGRDLAYIAARNVADTWWRAARGTADESIALSKLQDSQKAYVDFQ